MGDGLKEIKWQYVSDSTITDSERNEIQAIDPVPDGTLMGEEIQAIFSRLEEQWAWINRIDFPNRQGLDAIVARFHERFPAKYFRILRCINRPRENPNEVKLIRCAEGKEWRPIKPESLINVPALTKRVATAISYIEQQGYGKVDRYGIDKRCDTFHFHLVLQCCAHLDDLHTFESTIAKKAVLDRHEQRLAFAIKLLDTAPANVAIVYHTDEHTTRFAVYSMNRNLIDGGDGTIEHREGPSNQCTAVSPWTVGADLMVSLEFAIIPKDHALYERGHPLPDGRRFIIWDDFE